MNIERLENESVNEYKIRLGMAKVRKQIDLDWSELINLLGLECSVDKFRHDAYAWVYFDDNFKKSISTNKIATRILSISDTHVPFQLPVETFSKYAGKVDILQINGDVLDCYSLSSFTKTQRISPIEEMVVGRKYLIDLINYIKPKKVIVTVGNHCKRLGIYMAKNLDTDIQELIPETALDYLLVDGFTRYDRETGTKIYYEPLRNIFKDIEIVFDGKYYVQIGDAIFCHPSAYSSGIMKTTEKAMLHFRNEGFNFKTLVMSHVHKIGQYKIGNTMLYEQGCCCDTSKMKYIDGKLQYSQKEGFLYLCQDKDGNTLIEETVLEFLN